MPVLIVPPTEFIVENQKVIERFQSQARQYRTDLSKGLGAGQRTLSLTKSAYRGTDFYNWKQPYDGILATYFVFNAETRPRTFFLKMSTLIRRSDCVQMGTIWEKNPGVPLPEIQNSQVKIADIAERKFDLRSPVRIKTEFHTKFWKRGQVISDGIFSEFFAREAIPTVSPMARLYCKMFAPTLKVPDGKQVTGYPAKPHQFVSVKLTAKDIKSHGRTLEQQWPQVKAKIQSISGTFGEVHKTLLDTKEFQSLNPANLAQKTVTAMKPDIVTLNEDKFTIVKRDRAWVWLDRGFAYGLQVGTRLLGPHGAKLHIIRFDPEAAGKIDAAIAYVRREDKEKPLEAGDVLRLDPDDAVFGNEAQ